MVPHESVSITAEVTPNPNTLKFNVNKTLLESGSLNFPDRPSAKGALLPEKLFEVDSVLGVMIGKDFITVTKVPSANWQTIVPAVTECIQSVLSSGQALFPQEIKATAAASGSGKDSDIEQKIRRILDNEIRPAVAMDGGDITFYGYRDGVVILHLQGSCSSCPSSIMTLKMGVENRLRQEIPEVKEVVQV